MVSERQLSVSDEQIREVAGGVRQRIEELVERRKLVATKEYVEWLKDFASNHHFSAESGYGIMCNPKDDVDEEKVGLILDFIELGFKYFYENGIDTNITEEGSPFPEHGGEVVIGEDVFRFTRLEGQGVAYGFGRAARPRDDLARADVEDIILTA